MRFHLKQPVYRRSSSGKLIEILTRSKQPTTEYVPNSPNQPSNKLSKSKSDTILKLFRRSSQRREEKPAQYSCEEGTKPILKNSRSAAVAKGKQQPYRAYRSGTGPLILVRQPPPNEQQSVNGTSEASVVPDTQNKSEQKLPLVQSKVDQTPSATSSELSLNQKKKCITFDLHNIPNEKEVTARKDSSEVTSEGKVDIVSQPNPDASSTVKSNVRENLFKKFLPPKTSRSIKTSEQSCTKGAELSGQQVFGTKKSDIKEKSEQSRVEDIKKDFDLHQTEKRSSECSKRNFFQALVSSEKKRDSDSTKEKLTPGDKSPRVNRTLKIRKQKTPQNNSLEDQAKSQIVSIDLHQGQPPKRAETSAEKRFEFGLNKDESRNIKKNEECKQDGTNETVKVSLKKHTERTASAPKSHSNQGKNSIEKRVYKLPPKVPKSSYKTNKQEHKSQQEETEEPKTQNLIYQESEQISESTDSCQGPELENSDFHQQNAIRETQEKKILELHLKHLQEIQRLRSQPLNHNATKSNTIVNQSPPVLNIRRKQYLFTREERSDSPTGPSRLIRSRTYDNASDFYSNIVSSSDDNQETAEARQESQLLKSPKQIYSFSSYLIRSRKNSLGENDKRPQSEVIEGDKDIKIDVSKRVHFPDDSELKSSCENGQADARVKSSGNGVKWSISTAPTPGSNTIHNSLPRRNKVSILKKSNSVEDGESCVNEFRALSGKGSKERLGSLDKLNDLILSSPPVKPPRGAKLVKRTRPLVGSSDVTLEMSSLDHINQKDPALKYQPQGQGKENSSSGPQNDIVQSDQTTPPLQQQQRNNDSQKRKYQQESSITQAEHTTEFPNRRNSFERKRAEAKVQTQVKPPNPPSRGHKPLLKNISDQGDLSAIRPQENAKPVEGVLVTACKDWDEDQIMKLLRDLTKKLSNLDASFINQVDHSGRTAFSHACNAGSIRVVEFLSSEPHIDMNLVDSEGNSPLHYAAQGGHIEVVSHLVNTCSRHVDLDVRNNLGFTPLMKAALQGRTKIAKILLFAGASPHLRDYGRGLNAVEWAKYTGRGACGELIESVQRSCSSHIRDRWTTSSDPDIRLARSGSNPSLTQYQDNKDNWLKHKIKKAFNKSESKKEFSVASNLSTLATCVSSPLLPSQVQKAQDSGLPKVKVTEVCAPDCYSDPPDDRQSVASPQRGDDYSSSEGSSGGSSPTSPDQSKEFPTATQQALEDTKDSYKASGFEKDESKQNQGFIS